MLTPTAFSLEAFIDERLRARNGVVRAFFESEAPRLTSASALLARRFARGGRIFAFGRGPYATDAAHVSVEFVHPVIVGKRALPALDASAAYDALLDTLATPNDVAIGFGPPAGDPDVLRVLARARGRGVLTFAWPGARADDADYSVPSPSDDLTCIRRFLRSWATPCTKACTFSSNMRSGSQATAARQVSCTPSLAARRTPAKRTAPQSRARSSPKH